VLLVVTLVFAALGLVVWGLTWQMNHLVEDRANIRTKIADVRLAGRGSAVEKLQEMLEGFWRRGFDCGGCPNQAGLSVWTTWQVPALADQS
jgi:hypothetical protein